MATITHGNIRIETNESDSGSVYAMAWRGKAKSPFANYRFRDLAHRAEWIQRQKDEADSREASKATRKVQKASAIEAMRASMEVGTILYTSWGYDQTNINFYLIVERKGASATLQEIGKVQVGEEGFMCAQVKPNTEATIGEPMKKVIGEFGCKIGSNGATPTDPKRTYHCSWYA